MVDPYSTQVAQIVYWTIIGGFWKLIRKSLVDVLTTSLPMLPNFSVVRPIKSNYREPLLGKGCLRMVLSATIETADISNH